MHHFRPLRTQEEVHKAFDVVVVSFPDVRRIPADIRWFFEEQHKGNIFGLFIENDLAVTLQLQRREKTICDLAMVARAPRFKGHKIEDKTVGSVAVLSACEFVQRTLPEVQKMHLTTHVTKLQRFYGELGFKPSQANYTASMEKTLAR